MWGCSKSQLASKGCMNPAQTPHDCRLQVSRKEKLILHHQISPRARVLCVCLCFALKSLLPPLHPTIPDGCAFCTFDMTRMILAARFSDLLHSILHTLNNASLNFKIPSNLPWRHLFMKSFTNCRTTNFTLEFFSSRDACLLLWALVQHTDFEHL